MLLRFSVQNYLSVAETNEISLVASSLKGPECKLVAIPGTDLSALPSAIIYGANASGKTSFLRAFSFFRGAILNSHTQGDPEGGVRRVPFKLDPAKASEPTSFEAEFVLDGIRFQYGFECNDDVFTSEWLFSYPEGKRRRLFERNGKGVEFSSHLKGPKKILVEFMRPNSLFMSTATQNDHDELSKIVVFFRSARFSMDDVMAHERLGSSLQEKQVDPRTIEFLKYIGTGITGFRKKEVEIPEEVRNMSKELSAIFNKHLGDKAKIDGDISDQSFYIALEFAHPGYSGEVYYFGLERESSGTQRLILMLNTVFKALDEGGLVLIDEIDASLHTFAAAHILQLFQNPQINRNGAQLIATTHDTNLLDRSRLRRDQIWFCEKDEFGASHLFALSDIKSRPTDNFEQGYLEGRYGAMPPAGDFVSIFGAQ